MARAATNRLKRKTPVRANPGAMKEVLAARKVDTLILGKINTHLLSREDGERDMTMLHPSVMAKQDWCHRRSFYELSPEHPEPPAEDIGYVLQNIFDEGHYVHAKYQDRLWDLGLLRGWFYCSFCESRWRDTSPQKCLKCSAPRGCLAYKEVPLKSMDHWITGHADGDIALTDNPEDDPLLEVKTIGEGTVRVEYPTLLYDFTTETVDGKTVTDLTGLWGAIKRPFPSHLRQAMIYLAITGRKRMVFIYECKWNQQTKEFVVKYSKSIAEPLLDLALDVKYALEKNRPPTRPGWADLDHPTCSKCPYMSTCYNTEKSDGQGQPGAEADSGSRRGEEAEAPRRDPDSTPAEVRRPEGAAPARRVVRRRDDASLRRADPLD